MQLLQIVCGSHEKQKNITHTAFPLRLSHPYHLHPRILHSASHSSHSRSLLQLSVWMRCASCVFLYLFVVFFFPVILFITPYIIKEGGSWMAMPHFHFCITYHLVDISYDECSSLIFLELASNNQWQKNVN